MSIPKEPRQQMINMMYLVLTALLALNVSAEVLNAFKLVADGMDNSNTVVTAKNNTVLSVFSSAAGKGTQEQQQLYQSALKAQQLSDNFVVYIDSLREELVRESGTWVIEDSVKDLKDKKNYDGPTRLMIKQGKGDSLEARIADLKTQLLALPGLTPADVANLTKQITLTTDYDKNNAKKLNKKTWAAYHFDHVPIVAVNTLLYKFQGDAINSSGQVIERLYAKVGEAKYDFDQLNATLSAPASYVMKGDPYTARLFLSASSSSTSPKFYTGAFDKNIAFDASGERLTKTDKNPLVGGGTPVPADEIKNGVWDYKDAGTSVAGERVKTGAIEIPKPGSPGQFEYYTFDFRYQVADLGVAVSPDKMNVFYIGVDNPVTISVTGMTSDQVNASLTGGMGSIKKVSGSSYVVNVNKVGETDVVVTGNSEGKSKQLDSKKFRVKRVPDPVAKVGTLAGGKVATATFKVQRGVIADLADFVFDVRFLVVSFELTYAAKRQDLIIEKATSGAFTSKMLELMSRAKPGDTFYLDEVRVKGPDNQIRKLPSASYSLI